MREHMGLFRGKRLDSGEWVEGFYVEFSDPLTGNHERYIQTVKSDGRLDLIHKVDPNTVGECTGLPDVNSKLIFEGDIFDWGYAGVKDKRYVVVYDTEMASFVGERGCGFVTLNGIDIEIIGNIHDNPQLLLQEE